MSRKHPNLDTSFRVVSKKHLNLDTSFRVVSKKHLILDITFRVVSKLVGYWTRCSHSWPIYPFIGHVDRNLGQYPHLPNTFATPQYHNSHIFQQSNNSAHTSAHTKEEAWTLSRPSLPFSELTVAI